MKCSICGKESVISIPYMNESLCSSHFLEHFESTFMKEVRRQIKIGPKGGTVSVALSGGKDSSVTLFLLHKILSPRKKVKLRAFTVDEGIAGYRDRSIETARELCRSLGVEHTVVSFRDQFETTMDEEVTDLEERTPCAVCGPMRRQLINMAALEQESDYVALGLNLDDMAQSVLMNVARGDVERILRMAPHMRSVNGLVRRVVPLRRLSEREVVTYALLKNIKYDAGWCPYYSQAQRNLFRKIVSEIEEKYPGSKLAMIRLQENLSGAMFISDEPSVGTCKRCGKPSSGELCSVCLNSGEEIA